MATSSIQSNISGVSLQMSGATTNQAGTSGSVPTPPALGTGSPKALLSDATWGEISGADTVQAISATGNITAWNSIVEIGATPLTANIALTLPTCAGNIGKKIVLKRLDSANFTVTIAPFAGQTVEVTTTDLNTQYGAIIIEVVSATKSEQIANLGGYVSSEYGIVQLNNQTFSTTTFADSTNGMFNIPSAGVWKLRYDVSTDGTGVTIANSMLAITDPSDIVITGSEKSRAGASSVGEVLTAEVIVTTTGAATYKLRGRNGGSGAGSMTILNNASYDSTLSWQKISGYLPVNGYLVDYCGVEQHSVGTATNLTTVASTNVTTSGTTLVTGSRVVLTGATVSGNLTVNTANGTISIVKDGTYNVVVTVNTQTAGANAQWGQLVKNNTTVLTASSAYAQLGGVAMQITFTYTGDFVTGDLIDCRLSANSAGTIGITGYSYSVVQIGSSAFSTLNTFVGASAGTAGLTGGVPAPLAGQQNTFLRGDGSFSKPVFSGARRFASAATSIPNTGTATLVTTGTVDYTAGTDVTTGTANTITIATAGYYRITGSVGLATGTTTANYHARILIGGSTIAQGGNVTSVADTQTMQVTTTQNLTVGQLVTLGASQISGAAQNTVSGSIRTYLEVEFLGI